MENIDFKKQAPFLRDQFFTSYLDPTYGVHFGTHFKLLFSEAAK